MNAPRFNEAGDPPVRALSEVLFCTVMCHSNGAFLFRIMSIDFYCMKSVMYNQS